MRNLFETGKIKEVTIGDYLIILLKTGCFQVRNTKTGFINYESSSTSSYEEVTKWCKNVQNL